MFETAGTGFLEGLVKGTGGVIAGNLFGSVGPMLMGQGADEDTPDVPPGDDPAPQISWDESRMSTEDAWLNQSTEDLLSLFN